MPGAGVGLVALIVGIVVAVAGGSVSRNAAVAAAKRPETVPSAAEPAVRRRILWVAGGVVGIFVVGLAVMAWSGSGGGEGLMGSFTSQSGPRLLAEQTFDGRVVQAYSTPLESGTVDSSQSNREFQTPAGTHRVELNLTWTPRTGGTDDLRIIIEIQEGGDWREIDRVSGKGPLTMILDGTAYDSVNLRYRVFPNAAASLVSEQPFQVGALFCGS